MGWIDIVKTIADFGFVLVAAAFVLWQLYQHVIMLHKKDENAFNNEKEKQKEKNKVETLKNERYEKMLDSIQEKQDMFYKMLLEDRQKQDERCSTMLKEIIALYEKPHVLSSEENARMTKIDEEIDLFLTKTLIACNASRVSLIKYHNGGNDMLGNSILKMSMSNEKCAAGISHILQNCQNQIRSAFPYLIKELNDNGHCFVHNIESLEAVDNSLYQFTKSIGVKAKYIIAIQDTKNNDVIGYLSIDFVNNNDINIEQVKHCLNDKKLKIEALLNLKED